MACDGVWACVESGSSEFFAHVDDVFAQVFGKGLGMSVRCPGFRGDRFRATGIEVGQDLVDTLAGDSESLGDFCGWLALVSYGFNDCEVAVGAVHLSTMSRLIPMCVCATQWLVGVNYVVAEVSTIRKVLAGTPCQPCRDFGQRSTLLYADMPTA